MNNTIKPKILVLLPDGIGLRNFAYSNFYQLGIENNFDVVFWNNTPFNLTDLGFNEIKIKNAKTHPITDIYKNARKQIELNLNINTTRDRVYDTYRFPFPYNTLKSAFKSSWTQWLTFTNSSPRGLKKIRAKIEQQERKTFFYHQSLQTLQEQKPALVFCTNQRPSLAIAPILAAKDLGIPTATFIFSWDNLPKATMVVETDYYLVWSDHMKNELLFYYPYINEANVFVTGTPQFEAHFNASKILSREEFCQQHHLDPTKEYLCFSGDDITTSPYDPIYLEDVAKAVTELNHQGANLGILFRRCPVDFSSRYDAVLKQYNSIITPIVPLWKSMGEEWNTILPTAADVDLQINTIAHTAFVINLGSSMVFDYAAFNKPCMYVNYDPEGSNRKEYIKMIYNYVHFRSMPNKDVVVWLNNPKEIKEKIAQILDISTAKKHSDNALLWFEKIVAQPADQASKRIWNAVQQIISNP